MSFKINFSSSLKQIGGMEDINDVFHNIKEGVFASKINEYRESLNSIEIKSEILKTQLPCFTISGYFQGTRTLDGLIHYNPLIGLDYDLKDQVKAKEIIVEASENPYVYCGFISPTYGVKLFIKTDSNEDSHEDYFNEVRAYFDNYFGTESDSRVKDITRLCFVSDDPDLILNSDSLIFTKSKRVENELEILWDFTENKITYKQGDRNNFAFQYSCNASRSGISFEETLTYLRNKIDIDEKELTATVNSAYKKTISEFNKFGRGSLNSTSSLLHYQTSTEGQKIINYDFKSSESPSIKEEWYDLLPSAIKEACEQFEGREKDIFITGLLTTLSAALHDVTGVYAGDIISPNLLSFVVAPAASGKSSIKYSREVLKCYHEVVKSSDSFNNKLFFIPANSSSSMIYELLENNDGIGLIFETEADTISNALKQEWGDFSDVLRKCFHNEPISMARKQNSEYFEVERPRFGVCLTGTPEQVAKFIPSTENGLYSRFLFYSFSEEFEWNDTLLTIEPTKHNYFEELNAELCKLLSESNPRKFSLTNDQAIRFNKKFRELSHQIAVEYPNAVDQIKRAGLKVYKIAMTLSAFRNTLNDIVCDDNEFEFALNSVTEVYLPHQINVMSRLYNKFSGLNGADLLFEKLPSHFNRNDAVNTFDTPPSNRTISNYLEVLIKKGKIVRVSKGNYKKM